MDETSWLAAMAVVTVLAGDPAVAAQAGAAQAGAGPDMAGAMAAADGRVVDLHGDTAWRGQELADAARVPDRDTLLNAATDGAAVAETTVLFGNGSALLTPGDTRQLDRFGRAVPGGGRILVEGFPDTTGSRDARRDLARRRAAATVDYLETLGIPPDRLTLVAFTSMPPGRFDGKPAEARRCARVVLQ